jgi:hypothetical protein
MVVIGDHNTGAMVVTGDHNTRRKTCPGVNTSIANQTSTELSSNTELTGEASATEGENQ